MFGLGFQEILELQGGNERGYRPEERGRKGR